ncbi:DUF433 domain-containing protein [Microbulbifer sp. 2205BS26-8]|uniref:DUF433 domain-containing protein n=1 Tax=Microbulbifer sp. 2205BS26-8 TaxID=3064386 RepID=UPI00273FF517|nr:DUF433 domain-containing protein [Microbulbifer sp. 2205BS26-8]MDP5210963.1 DUF433 domain-containing protein [Microbulbifer sp. 2205BS26-8]
MEYQPYIEVDPQRRGGKACIKGTRIAVADILDMLGDGMSFNEIIDDYPDLNSTKIRAALSYAAAQQRKGRAA